jgi:hypothetical protein
MPVPVIHHHLIHSRHLSAFTTKLQTQKTLTKRKKIKTNSYTVKSLLREELDRQLLQQQQQQKQKTQQVLTTTRKLQIT